MSNFRVKKDVFTNYYNKGGLKKVSIKEFIMSLKLMSMKKKMDIKNNNLLSMLNLDIIKILLCGKANIIERIDYLGNNYWKDVLKSW